MILVSLYHNDILFVFQSGVRMCFAHAILIYKDNLISMLVHFSFFFFLFSIFFFGVNFDFGMFFADVNECLNLTICHNGGECINKVGSYACSCKEGWTGQHCHIGRVISLFLMSW